MNFCNKIPDFINDHKHANVLKQKWKMTKMSSYEPIHLMALDL